MPVEMKLTIRTMDGDEHEVESPVDIKVDDLIKDLVNALRLPLRDADNNPIIWRIDDKNLGRALDGHRTLGENGVVEGHTLFLLRATTAGRV